MNKPLMIGVAAVAVAVVVFLVIYFSTRSNDEAKSSTQNPGTANKFVPKKEDTSRLETIPPGCPQYRCDCSCACPTIDGSMPPTPTPPGPVFPDKEDDNLPEPQPPIKPVFPDELEEEEEEQPPFVPPRPRDGDELEDVDPNIPVDHDFSPDDVDQYTDLDFIVSNKCGKPVTIFFDKEKPLCTTDTTNGYGVGECAGFREIDGKVYNGGGWSKSMKNARIDLQPNTAKKVVIPNGEWCFDELCGENPQVDALCTNAEFRYDASGNRVLLNNPCTSGLSFGSNKQFSMCRKCSGAGGWIGVDCDNKPVRQCSQSEIDLWKSTPCNTSLNGYFCPETKQCKYEDPYPSSVCPTQCFIPGSDTPSAQAKPVYSCNNGFPDNKDITRFEINLNQAENGEVWYNLSGVDGANVGLELDVAGGESNKCTLDFSQCPFKDPYSNNICLSQCQACNKLDHEMAKTDPAYRNQKILDWKNDFTDPKTGQLVNCEYLCAVESDKKCEDKYHRACSALVEGKYHTCCRNPSHPECRDFSETDRATICSVEPLPASRKWSKYLDDNNCGIYSWAYDDFKSLKRAKTKGPIKLTVTQCPEL